MGLTGDTDYKAFSNVFYEDFASQDRLIKKPEKVSEDGYVGLAGAVWKYMTP